MAIVCIARSWPFGGLSPPAGQGISPQPARERLCPKKPPMPLAPPPYITEILEALGLTAASEVRRAGRHVRRLTRQLPQFESVWLDALAQNGVLTRWQASEIGGGRGKRLRLGPYVLTEPLPDCLYATSFRARDITSGQEVRLIVAERTGRAAMETAGRLRELVEAASARINTYDALPIAAGQVEQDSTPPATAVSRPDTCRPAGALRLWIAAPWIPGRSAADWLICHGRMPPVAVMEMARAMAAALVVLEAGGLCHGDIAASSLWIGSHGRIALPLPGVRGVLRPQEGYSRADLPPEAFDYLAPERVAQGTVPNIAADLYACGCVWWHLLCGRAPLGGGDSLAKLRAAHEARISDPRHWAPDTPAALAEAILACTRPTPERRPRSAAELAALLGPPNREGSRRFQHSLRAAERPGQSWPAMRSPEAPRRPRRLGQAAAMSLALAGALLVAAWPVWNAVRPHTEETPALRSEVGRPRPSEPKPTHQEPPTTHSAQTLDEDIVPAAYVFESEDKDQTDTENEASGPEATNGKLPSGRATSVVDPPHDLVLDASDLSNLERLALRAGQRVVGPHGARLRMRVPASGLHVAADNADTGQPIRFEGIDFIWDHPYPDIGAMVVVEAGNVRFRSCTFQGRGAGKTPAAVRWIHPPPSRKNALSLPSGSIGFDGCLFRNVATALDCQTRGTIRLEFLNVLHLGEGPLARSSHWPHADESIHLILGQVTVREAAALWQCRMEDSLSTPGRVLIHADDSVFALSDGGALVSLHGEGEPASLLPNLSWVGEGALVTPGTQVVTQQRPGGTSERLDDTGVPMAGLVLSRVEFAGPAGGEVANSELLRWNAPLRTAAAPGCSPARLPGLTLEAGRP